ncbi:MAG: hypothetical protein KC964_31960 [Candidatus Omnitrophica bacterium]|nr:hypothetical protein [Candidatus Omnitrophota bacterium]
MHIRNRILIGVPYSAVGLVVVASSVFAFIWFPGIEDYEQPHACACGECLHSFVRSSDGNMYCSVFPPREVKMASVTTGAVISRRVLGSLVALSALAAAMLSLLIGVSWMSGRATPDIARKWFNFVAIILPPIALCLLIKSVELKAVYGFTPL